MEDTLELFVWQTLYTESSGQTIWRTDPNFFSTFQECYDFGIETMSAVNSPSELQQRISIMSFEKSTMIRMLTVPFFYLTKVTPNAPESA